MSETWVIKESPLGTGVLYITKEVEELGQEIAVIYSGNMEHAHLIKAAPKMRDVLRAMFDECEAHQGPELRDDSTWGPIMRDAEQALAEANGETE